MPKRYALLFALLFALLPIAANAQDPTATPPPSKAARFIHHFDLGLSGDALITKSVTGTVTGSGGGTTLPSGIAGPYPLTQTASSTAGAVVQLRGEKSPYMGMELNYGYGRITESYSCCNFTSTDGDFQSQVTANEITVGYMVRPPHLLFGFQPYASVGAGSMVFSPTRNGGQGLQKQARAAYYYSAGLEDMLTPKIGLRLGVRQLFYLAPDFGQNYLLIKKHTFTTEPTFGVFVHF